MWPSSTPPPHVITAIIIRTILAEKLHTSSLIVRIMENIFKFLPGNGYSEKNSLQIERITPVLSRVSCHVCIKNVDIPQKKPIVKA